MSETPSKVRIGKLDTVGGVLAEAAKVYRQCRRGQLDSLHGSRLVAMLAELRRGMESSEFERRLEELEAERRCL